MLRVRPRSRPWVATALLVVATGPRWVAELGLADRVPDNRARVVRTVRLVRTCR